MAFPDNVNCRRSAFSASWCRDPRGPATVSIIVRQGTGILLLGPEQFRSFGNVFRESESQRFEADLSCIRSEIVFGQKRLGPTFGPLAFSVNVMAADHLSPALEQPTAHQPHLGSCHALLVCTQRRESSDFGNNVPVNLFIRNKVISMRPAVVPGSLGRANREGDIERP
ncbi:uncharacterized protein M421DRAFT_412429 [Didymella exigua CBS 183.55]|uniref:Uncharacterized protein n=1 Tax=Didymella exigua CBS 183.55 TaxID=1150837 RepID=A0A6A5RSK7_9PLEO|nr:uncharacterized protein M421DRAFT_412429 [Didymella exigua CBS 183.55]KAF1930350.1 hypothetical protein M421DRAFT_412429 [Didymella exigua CBS 183.55]